MFDVSRTPVFLTYPEVPSDTKRKKEDSKKLYTFHV